jgi:hypothetical protein
VGIDHTHHVDPIPMTLSLDGDFIPVFVSRTLARANVRMKKSSDSGRHVSNGWKESVAFAVLNVALPQLAGNDLNLICGVGWIMTAHDSIANGRERLGQRALDDAQLSCRQKRDKHERSDDECRKLAASRSSRMMAKNSVYDHGASLPSMPPSWVKRTPAWYSSRSAIFWTAFSASVCAPVGAASWSSKVVIGGSRKAISSSRRMCPGGAQSSSPLRASPPRYQLLLLFAFSALASKNFAHL